MAAPFASALLKRIEMIARCWPIANTFLQKPGSKGYFWVEECGHGQKTAEERGD
jgi:hypothetical protein